MLTGVYHIMDKENDLHHDHQFSPEMSDLTTDECALGFLAKLLTYVLCAAYADKLHSIDTKYFTQIEAWMDCQKHWLLNLPGKPGSHLLPIAQELNAPNWCFYHKIYTAFDGLRLIGLTLDEVVVLYEPEDRSRVAWFQELKKGIEKKRMDLCEGLQRATKTIRIPLEQSESVRQLLRAGIGCEEDTEDLVGQELRQLPDNRDLMEALALRMLASWGIGLDNVHNLFDKELH